MHWGVYGWAIFLGVVCLSVWLVLYLRAPEQRRTLVLAGSVSVMQLCLGLMFGLLGIAIHWHESRIATFKAVGLIAHVAVKSSGRNAVTFFQVQMKDGAVAHLFARGHSNYFRPGETVTTVYYSGSGELKKAIFSRTDGAREGEFNEETGLSGWPQIGFGIFWIVMALRRWLHASRGSGRAYRNGVDPRADDLFRPA